MHFSGGYFGGLARLGLGFDPSTVQANAVAVQQGRVPLQPGMCTSDGAFIWRGDHWERRRANESCNGYSTITGDTRVHDATNPGGGVFVNGADHGPVTVVYDFDNSYAASSNPADAGKSLQVGPFKIPLGAAHYTVHWEGKLPADWQAFILPELGHDCSNCVFTSMEDATAGHVLGTLQDFFDGLPPKVNKDLVTRPDIGFLVNGKVVYQLPGGQSAPLAIKISLPDQPIAVVSRPDTGDEWGLYMVILPRDPTYLWDSTTNPYVLTFYWQPKPQGVWDWIKRIVGAIVNGVESIACFLAPVLMKTPPKDAVTAGIVAGSVILQATGACTPDCPAGMSFNASVKACVCPPGMSYDAASKACIVAPSTSILSQVPWWAWLGGGLLTLGVIFKVAKGRRSLPVAT